MSDKAGMHVAATKGCLGEEKKAKPRPTLCRSALSSCSRRSHRIGWRAQAVGSWIVENKNEKGVTDWRAKRASQERSKLTLNDLLAEFALVHLLVILGGFGEKSWRAAGM